MLIARAVAATGSKADEAGHESAGMRSYAQQVLKMELVQGSSGQSLEFAL